MVLFKRLASAVALLRSLIMPLRLRLRDDLYPSTWANVEMKKVKRAVNFLKCALRCASSHQGQKRACWEQLRASLRRKERNCSFVFNRTYVLAGLRSKRVIGHIIWAG